MALFLLILFYHINPHFSCLNTILYKAMLTSAVMSIQRGKPKKIDNKKIKNSPNVDSRASYFD